MDRKGQKRDIGVFANMLKDMMNKPTVSPMATLDRDLRHFIFGRVLTLVKHNDGNPIGSPADVGYVVGTAFAMVLTEFLAKVATGPELKEMIESARTSLIEGFDESAPQIEETQPGKSENDPGV